MEITLKDGGTLGIGAMPGRKRKALYRMHGCRIDPIAYFSTDEDARWVVRFLGEICDLANATTKAQKDAALQNFRGAVAEMERSMGR